MKKKFDLADGLLALSIVILMAVIFFKVPQLLVSIMLRRYHL